MEKTLGKCFRSPTANYTGRVSVYGSWYDYKVTAGVPAIGVMLEVTGFTTSELLVRVNNYLFESDVNYLG